MYSMGNLRNMEVIDLNTGTKLGYIKDFKVDCDESKIVSIIMPGIKTGIFSKINDTEIPWEKVKLIGVDVILVDGYEYVSDDKNKNV